MRLLAALLCLFAFTARAETPLAIGYQPTIDTAPLFVAKEQGLFAKAGIDATLTAGVGQVQIAGVAAGSLQVGQPTMPQLFQAIESGIDLVIIAGDNFTSPEVQEFGVVERKGLDLSKPQAFIGKRVAVNTVGAFLHVLFVDWLKRGGVDPAKVTFVEVPFPSMGDVMKQGNIDAALPVEPFISRMVQAGTGDVVDDYIRDVPSGLPVVAYVAQRDWAAKNRATVEAFRAALDAGHKLLLANREQGMADVGKWLKLPPAVLAGQKLPVMHVDVPAAGLEAWAKILRNQDLIHAEPNISAMLWK